MDRENESSSKAFGDTVATREDIVTMGRIINVVIAIVCLLGMISCIVCLGVMADKHHDIINIKDPNHKVQNDKEVCILFTSSEAPDDSSGKWKIKYNKSHTCQFVIAGSGIVAGLLLIAAIYYILRLFIMRR